MFSKKGQSGAEFQQSMFLIAEIFIGALVIVAASYYVVNSFQDTNEKLLAKDFALSVSTMMGSPSNLYYRYSPNTEQYNVFVDETGFVRFTSRKGQGSFNMILLEGIDIEGARISNSLSVPIRIQDSKLLFNDETAQETIDICAGIPTNFKKEVKIYFEIFNKYSNSKDTLNSIKNRIIAFNSLEQNSKIKFVDRFDSPDYNLIISFDEDKDDDVLKIYYYDSSSSLEHHKLSCSLAAEFRALNYFDNVIEIPEITTQQILIELGSFKKFEEKRIQKPDIYDHYAETIFKGLKEAIGW